ncbi:MAG: MBL fold metallo-hydrolase [Clostridiales bacterium]|nr:MBL fold metallo-hydrolase [Clostridiales bacterium]
MKITWLGHACFKIEKAGFVLIIDPYQDGSVPGLLPIRDDEAGFGYDVIGTAADFTRYFDRVEMADGSEIETGDTFTAPVVVLQPARR